MPAEDVPQRTRIACSCVDLADARRRHERAVALAYRGIVFLTTTQGIVHAIAREAR